MPSMQVRRQGDPGTLSSAVPAVERSMNRRLWHKEGDYWAGLSRDHIHIDWIGPTRCGYCGASELSWSVNGGGKIDIPESHAGGAGAGKDDACS
jgi:hypothetical protein